MRGSRSPLISPSPTASRLSLSRLFGGGLLLLALLVQCCYAVPQATTTTPTVTEGDGEGFPTLSSGVQSGTGRIGTSEYSWVSTWASNITNADATPTPHASPILITQGPSTNTSSQSQHSSGKNGALVYVVVPIVVVFFACLTAMGVMLLIRWRRMRALRAHRRKSSWAAAGKYKWNPDDAIMKRGYADEAPPYGDVTSPNRASFQDRKSPNP